MNVEFGSRPKLRRIQIQGLSASSKVAIFFLVALVLLLPHIKAYGGLRTSSNESIVTIFDISPKTTSNSFPSATSKSQMNSFGENWALLTVNQEGSRILRAMKTGDQIGISLLLVPGLDVSASVTMHEIYKKEARTVLMTDTGAIDVQRPDLYFYRGKINGDSASWVELTIGKHYIIGTALYNGEIYRFGPLEKPSSSSVVPHISYSIDSFDTSTWKERPFCAISGLNLSQLSIGGNGTDSNLNLEDWTNLNRIEPEYGTNSIYDQVELALDGDYEMYTKFGNDQTSVFSYYASLVNTINAIYHNILNVDLTISYQTVWTTTSGSYPYTKSSTLGLLYQMRAYWNSNNSRIRRDLAFLLSGKSVQGGIAYLDVLCNNSYGYGLTQVHGTYDTTTWDGMWDVVATAHELGHNHGSSHTHCYRPPIDECYNGEAGCYSGAVTCTKGTIMSYCHSCGGMFNVDLQFHSRVIAVMRRSVDSATCLTHPATPPTVTTSDVSSVTSRSAFGGGNVTVDGGVSVTVRGVCWSNYANPTTSNDKTTDGTGIGSFTSEITGLSSKTTYHARAYATNSIGTGYGADLTFTTSPACPPCSGENVVLNGVTYAAGETCECTGATILLLDVTVQNSATVNFTATTLITVGSGTTFVSGSNSTLTSPKMTFQPGSHVESGAVFNVGQ